MLSQFMKKINMCPSEYEWPVSQHSLKWSRYQLIKEAMACYWWSNNTLPKKINVNWVNWINRLNWVNWLTPKLETLKSLSTHNIAYCRTTTCNTCKFRPLSYRPTVETDVQNRRCITSIYNKLFQIGFRHQTSKP